MITTKRDRHLVLVGCSGAGKTSIAMDLSERANVPVVEIGKFVVAEAKGCPLCKTPLEHANHTFISGDTLHFVRKAAERVRSIDSAAIIVGPRMVIELEYLKTEFPGLVTVGLKASRNTRLHRWLNRSENMDITYAAPLLNERDIIELSWGLDTTIASCSTVLENDNELITTANKVWEVWNSG
jgi:adenylate kinase family enzyme